MHKQKFVFSINIKKTKQTSFYLIIYVDLVCAIQVKMFSFIKYLKKQKKHFCIPEDITGDFMLKMIKVTSDRHIQAR